MIKVNYPKVIYIMKLTPVSHFVMWAHIFSTYPFLLFYNTDLKNAPDITI